MRIFCFCCRRIPLVVKQKAFLFHPTNLPPVFSSSKTSVSVCFYDFLRSFVSLFYFIFIVAFVISYFMIHLTAKKLQQRVRSFILKKPFNPCLSLFISRERSRWKAFSSTLFFALSSFLLSRVFMFEEIFIEK